MTTETENPDPSLSLDRKLELLTHHHRREILCFLSGSPDHTATVDELIDRLLDREAERPGSHPERDTIEITLHHTHIPRLADAGVVEYDSRSKQLRYWPHAPLEELLKAIQFCEPD